ncbi:MAG: hypothetical protein HC912_06100 [Saprospiraceae bacterium]|nr:hypothetical protein [Saprospiraceae bacterium]
MQKSVLNGDYLRYYFRATTYYRVHSPMAYEFAQAILEDNRNFYAFEQLKSLQKLALKDQRSIALTHADQKENPTIGTIQQIAKQNTVKSYYYKLLFRIIHYYKPAFIVELGTSLGLSTMYAAAAALDRNIYTIEKEPAIANAAKQHFNLLRFKNIETFVGDYHQVFDNELFVEKNIDALIISPQVDLTLETLEKYMGQLTASSWVIVVGIADKAKKKIWNAVQEHPKITLSIAVYELGIAFCNHKVIEKQHLTLIATSKRAW